MTSNCKQIHAVENLHCRSEEEGWYPWKSFNSFIRGCPISIFHICEMSLLFDFCISEAAPSKLARFGQLPACRAFWGGWINGQDVLPPASQFSKGHFTGFTDFLRLLTDIIWKLDLCANHTSKWMRYMVVSICWHNNPTTLMRSVQIYQARWPNKL